ncbi:hypothetical protein [Leptolyngbya sp. CCY15150]|uniref:hypothetical protein n=1 Tax=Leptolyngbya sp. CCY15150 TaxID=2767772 RepID=UPI00194DE0D3|nr:hypothetical protein [Leptolyngbya sp. CCY15150]
MPKSFPFQSDGLQHIKEGDRPSPSSISQEDWLKRSRYDYDIEIETSSPEEVCGWIM